MAAPSGGLLAGDAVVLAGATGAVGATTLATVAREGARVLVVSRDERRAGAAIAAHVDPCFAPNCIPFAADLTHPDGGAAAVAACIARFGRIDALGSLAGDEAPLGPIAESTLADLQAHVRAYYEVAYNLALPALRAMLAQEMRAEARSRGRILTVTAGSSRTPAPRRGLFGAAKAATNVLMLAIAREHKADDIVCNALVLGGVAVEGSRTRRGEAAYRAAASPQEVADAVAFHLSDRSSGINGELIDLNARETD